MHHADLIPVLKALHADPSTAYVFADWFEERRNEGIARWLRRPAVADMKGPAMIRRLSETWSTVVTPELLAAEAFERLEVTAEIEDHFRQVCVLADMVTGPVGGTPDNQWKYFEVMSDGPMVFPVFVRPARWVPRISSERPLSTSVDYRSEYVRPRRIIPLSVDFQMLDGNLLLLSAVVWCGTLSDGMTVFGRLRKAHLTPHPRQVVSSQTMLSDEHAIMFGDPAVPAPGGVINYRG